MATSNVQYAIATIAVSNVIPGQKISVVLGNSAQTCWSSGPAFTTSSFNLISTSGSPVPVSTCKIAGSVLELITASNSSSDTLNFSFTLYVAATDNTNSIQLTSQTDPGPVLTFAFAGNTPMVLTATPTLIMWPS